MIPDQPLYFTPLFRSYIWGGRRLESFLGKPIPEEGQWAESWELVDHGPDQSVVATGTWAGWTLRRLIDAFTKEMLGETASSDTFPLLLKYLDCNRVLSVQVHPNDEYAQRMPKPDLGKTEAWYIMHAEPDSKIYAGLKPGIDRDTLTNMLETGRCEEALHQLTPQAGDCVFIPAGTVHALGSGLLVAEIQQASDTTFRLFDWNRLEKDGKPRPLHISQSLEVIDFDRGPVGFVMPTSDRTAFQTRLVDCDKFALDRFQGEACFTFARDRTFRILTVVRGRCHLTWDEGEKDMSIGETVLLPAAHQPLSMELDYDSVVLSATPPNAERSS